MAPKAPKARVTFNELRSAEVAAVIAPKAKRGRPRLTAARSERTLGVRVTLEEAEALAAYAAAEQTSVAELLRPAIRQLLQDAATSAKRTGSAK